MFRSIFYIFIFLLLSSISFYLSMISISYIKELDPIMKEIKNNTSVYEVSSKDAFIDDLIIVPGVKGKIIDVDSSYKVMKNYGAFEDDLLIYDYTLPKLSISNIYGKYVISGNSNKKEVSLVFKIESTNYLEEIISILKTNDVIGTFFIDEYLIYESIDIIDLLYLNNQNIELLSDEYSLINIEKINYYLNKYINKKISYCYVDSFNKSVLSICSFKKLHTIIPSINTSNYPYYDIKNKLSNGSIIKLNNNIRVVEELNYIIKYIRQKDYEIVSLKKLLSE